MITVRPAAERGHFDFGWLDTFHSFSFGDYYDPKQMGFRALRVINDDTVQPGSGFPTHPHRDMEIVTVVLEGAVQHKDSLGTSSVIRAGEVQRMSAGTGVLHSEWNPSSEEKLHLLQIWILPERHGLPPSYEQSEFRGKEQGKLARVVSPKGEDGALKIHQDVALYVSALAPGQKVEHLLAPGRHAWVQLARGAVKLNGQPLSTGDGAAVSGEELVALEATAQTELLLFDLA